MDTQILDRPVPPDLLHGIGIRSVYHPLVDLGTGRTVAHEALMRGPAGTPWESPLTLLAAARAAGTLTDLEQAAVSAALHGTGCGSPDVTGVLFVNLEPSTLTRHPDLVVAELDRRAGGLQVVVEITERALAADPAGVLAGAERLRAAGYAIALDDVGVERESLAFIPVLQPEVVKLDLSLLRSVDDPATITVAHAVQAYAEACGAEVVAEGIETEADLVRALVLGATLGQGWHWGRPGPYPVPAPAGTPHRRFAPRTEAAAAPGSPFDLVAGSGRLRTAPKHLLLPVSRTLEVRAMQSSVPPMLLACFQDLSRLTPATVRRYARTAETLPFVGMLGTDLPAAPAGGARGVPLSPADPLAREWTVLVLGAHEAVALIARDRDEPAARDADRLFDFVLTHDRAVVTAAAQTLVRRFPAS
ncbi:sensor domain-containing phosphodiesterase [Cellulomonas bogoriensis]|uniref:Phytochrome-like protein cph2 n=1 Tax=Cellulomonas bogoriensis 69B4 = DSM 16987 TaxID=1386082 RepID=A0A0A0BRI0_9CELL|nr:EAL domain-containing protein [Cellulomonas bogoriensis]KGM11083.1 phytochrome-like protein cph2 [Cellulomonas bogoriensis 69B4 = DSM 16987]